MGSTRRIWKKALKVINELVQSAVIVFTTIAYLDNLHNVFFALRKMRLRKYESHFECGICKLFCKWCNRLKVNSNTDDIQCSVIQHLQNTMQGMLHFLSLYLGWSIKRPVAKNCHIISISQTIIRYSMSCVCVYDGGLKVYVKKSQRRKALKKASRGQSLQILTTVVTHHFENCYFVPWDWLKSSLLLLH